jgi:hypothetical protein
MTPSGLLDNATQRWGLDESLGPSWTGPAPLALILLWPITLLAFYLEPKHFDLFSRTIALVVLKNAHWPGSHASPDSALFRRFPRGRVFVPEPLRAAALRNYPTRSFAARGHQQHFGLATLAAAYRQSSDLLLLPLGHGAAITRLFGALFLRRLLPAGGYFVSLTAASSTC